MTALSCASIGLAFLIAVGLLIVAGVAFGWVLEALYARRKARKDRNAV